MTSMVRDPNQGPLLLINCCVMKYPPNLELKTTNVISQFLWREIWEQPSWLVLAQSLSWWNQDVGWGLSSSEGQTGARGSTSHVATGIKFLVGIGWWQDALILYHMNFSVRSLTVFSEHLNYFNSTYISHFSFFRKTYKFNYVRIKLLLAFTWVVQLFSPFHGVTSLNSLCTVQIHTLTIFSFLSCFPFCPTEEPGQ